MNGFRGGYMNFEQNDEIGRIDFDEFLTFLNDYPSENMDSLEATRLIPPISIESPTTDSYKEEIEKLKLEIEEEAKKFSASKIELEIPSSSTASVESKSTSQDSEIEKTVAAYLLYSVMAKNTFEVLDDIITKLIDAFPDDVWRPKQTYSNLETGYWITKWMDEQSITWFMEVISKYSIFVGNIQTCVNAVPIKNLPTFYTEVDIKGQVVSDDKILARFAKQNQKIELSTSRWTNLKCIRGGRNEYKLCLEIDLASAERIKANGCKLYFGVGMVEFKIQDKLEAAAMDIIASEMRGMTY